MSDILRGDDQSESAALDMEGKAYVLRACAVHIGIGHFCLAISNDCRMFLFWSGFFISQAAMSRVSGESEGPCTSWERTAGLIMSVLSLLGFKFCLPDIDASSDGIHWLVAYGWCTTLVSTLSVAAGCGCFEASHSC